MQFRHFVCLTLVVGTASGAAFGVRATFGPSQRERSSEWKPLADNMLNGGPDDSEDLSVQCTFDAESGPAASILWHQDYGTSIGLQWVYLDETGNELGTSEPELIESTGRGSYEFPIDLPDVGGQGYRVLRFIAAAGLSGGGSVVQESDCHLYANGEGNSEVSMEEWASNSAIAEGVAE